MRIRTHTHREKEIYNKALLVASRLIKTYDGIIPDEIERQVIADAVLKLRKRLPKNYKPQL